MNEILFAIVFDNNDFEKTFKNCLSRFSRIELGKILKGIERHAVFVRPE